MSEQTGGIAPDDREAMLSHLQQLNNQFFEDFLGELWERQGWKTEVTRRSKDWGVDVVARRDSPVQLTLVIQAKRYSTARNVSSTEVQQYSSLRRQRESVDAVAIVTTAGFSDQARETAKALNVKTVNGDDLLTLIEETKAYGLVDSYVEDDVRIPNTSSGRQASLVDGVAHDLGERSEFENHVLEGYGLLETVPTDRYEPGETVHVVHSSSDSPIWIEEDERKTFDLDTHKAEHGMPVYLHLTSTGIRMFARECDTDVNSFMSYERLVDGRSDSALFGPSESITFEFADGRLLKYMFQSMSTEVRDAIEPLLAEKSGVQLTL